MDETDEGLRGILREVAHVAPAVALPKVAVGDVVGRYQLLRELGRGGFGVVYAARDVELGREVAMKVLRPRAGAEARIVEQFQREASIVARLRHPHIVTVYDWGRAGELPYLVLELLAGETLEARLRRKPLALDEALDVGLAVAGALAHAHGNEITHRDLKPSNVFLCDDGVAKVLDFGLAHAGAQPGLLDGAGTPAFMAPEQRAGEADARADVWAFGLVLLEACAGAGVRAPERAPAPLRGVIARALSVAKEARYADGRELVVALTGVRRKLLETRQRRRRAVVGLALSAAAAVVVAGGVIATRISEAARTRRAAEAAADIRRVEAELRYAHMAPLHDTRPDDARARAALATIEARVARLSSLEAGLAEYALGRGLLALGQPTAAVTHLRAAQRGGVDNREVQGALGEALGAAWTDAARALADISDEATRRERAEVIDRELRLPAVQLLEKSAPSSTLALARLAMWRQEAAEALALAERARAEVGWLYEADQVAAEVHERAARDAMWAGHYPEADAALARAQAAVTRALEVGRSDPRVHELACALAGLAVDVGAHRGRGTPQADHAERLACERALTVAPASVSALRLAAALPLSRATAREAPRESVARDYAEAEALAARVGALGDTVAALDLSTRIAAQRALQQAHYGEDVDATVTRGLASAERLLTLRDDEVSRGYVAELLYTRVRTQVDAGRSPLDAVATIENAMRGAQSEFSLTRLARAEVVRGEWEGGHGGDPSAAYERALAAYERVLRKEPGNARILDEASGVHYDLAIYQRSLGQDPADAFRRAVELGERAIALRPRSPVTLSNLGMVLSEYADSEGIWGRDMQPLLARAIELLSRSLELDAAVMDTHYNLSIAHRMRAEELVDHDADPGPELDAARAAAQRAIALQPKNLALTSALADVETVQARFLIRHDRSPLAPLARVISIDEKLLAADSGNESTRLGLSMQLLLRAEWQQAQRAPYAADVARVRELLAPLLASAKPTSNVRSRAARLAVLEALLAPPSARADAIVRAHAALAQTSTRPGDVREMQKPRALLARLEAGAP